MMRSTGEVIEVWIPAMPRAVAARPSVCRPIALMDMFSKALMVFASPAMPSTWKLEVALVDMPVSAARLRFVATVGRTTRTVLSS